MIIKQKKLNQVQKKSDEIVLLPMHCAPPPQIGQENVKFFYFDFFL